MANVIAMPTAQGVGAELLGTPVQKSDMTDGAAFAEALMAFLGNGVQANPNGVPVAAEVPVEQNPQGPKPKSEQHKEQGEQMAAAASESVVVPIVVQVVPAAVETPVPVRVEPQQGQAATESSVSAEAPVGERRLSLDELLAQGAETPGRKLIARRPSVSTGVQAKVQTLNPQVADETAEEPDPTAATPKAAVLTNPVGPHDSGQTVQEQTDGLPAKTGQTPATRTEVVRQVDRAVAARRANPLELPTALRASSTAAPEAAATSGRMGPKDDAAAAVRPVSKHETLASAIPVESRGVEPKLQTQTDTLASGQPQQIVSPPTTESNSDPDWQPPDHQPEITGLDAAAGASTENRTTFQVASDRPADGHQPARTELHARVIDQVVKEVRLHTVDGHSNVVVKLNPPELGSLRLQISQDSTGLTSQIQASTEQVGRLLQAHVPALVDALADAGLKLDSVTISSGPSFGALAQDLTQSNAQGSQYQGRRGNQRNTANGQGFVPIKLPTANARETGYSWLA